MKKYLLIFFVFSAIAIIISTKSFNDTTYIKKENINIEDYYYDSVITNTNGILYSINNNVYAKVGEFQKGSIFNLDKTNNEYFQIKGTDYYIYYKELEKYTESISTRYKNYIALGKKIITADKFNLYQNEDSYVTLRKSKTFDVIYIDGNKYYVLFNDILYYVLKDDILKEETTTSTNTNAKDVPVLNYHFIYDKDYEVCTEIICIEKDLFEAHLKYLKDNGFMTLTMNEFNLWLDGTLKIPEKSVLITFDDGALGTDTHLTQLLEKYDMNASLFLITAWWSRSKYESPNLEIYSHGHDIHLDNYCKKGPRGYCLTKEELIEDFSLSIPLVDNNLAFCYPFYAYNNTMISALKELDFKVAFIGGNKKAKRTDNKLLLPRYIIYYNTDINIFKNIVN